METSRFSQIGWKRLGKSATWLHIMIVSGTRPVPVSFRSCLSIGAVRTPMNGGATIGTLSERTLPAPPLSSPWKTNRWLRMEEQIHQPHGPLSGNSCNGNGIPRGLAITRIVVMTTDAHHPWFHDPLIMICKRPPEVGDRAGRYRHGHRQG